MEGAQDRLSERRPFRGSLPPLVVARIAAALFSISGVIVFVTLQLPLRPGAVRGPLALVGFGSLLAGVVTWFAPWDRWHERATLFLTIPALLLLAAGNMYGGIEPYSYGTYFMLMFAWVGISHPRGIPALLGVPAGVIYTLPLLLEERSGAEISTVAVVIPLCVLVGEFLAWTTNRLRRVETALRESAESYEVLFQDNPQPMFLYDLNTLEIFAVNDAAVEHYGYSRQEFLAMTILDIRPPEDIPAVLENVARSSPGLERSGVWRHQKNNGTVIEVEIASHSLMFEGRDARQVLVNDVTEKNRALRDLRTIAGLSEFNPAPVLRLDKNGIIITINPATETFFGSALLGKRWASVCPGVGEEAIRDLAERGGSLQQEINVADRTLLLAYRGLPQNDAVHVYGFEITATRMAEARLTHQSLHDALTGLANRELFIDRLTHSSTRRSRQSKALSLLHIDLDDFKSVNDTLGHRGGDRLLTEIARRIEDVVRPEDTVARFGADEFSVLLEETDQDEAIRIAERLLERIRLEVELEARRLSVTASIGVVSTSSQVEPEQLIRDADAAMHVAKKHGKNRLQVFDPSMHVEVTKRLELRRELEEAIENSEFVLQYQPIVDLSSRSTVSVEGLIRWNHPRDGMLAPGMFIPFAEGSDLIHAIGRWVLESAAKQARGWAEQSNGKDSPTISVNLSARELERPGLVQEIEATLGRFGVEPSLLSIEITESTLLGDLEEIVGKLEQLRELGLKIAIDDFGTGYSSLSYLQRLPVDVLKIDKAFTDGVTRGSEESALAHAIVKLAHSLRLTVVAEGIETEEQAAVLREWGCDLGQGFLFSRPLDPSDVDLGQQPEPSVPH